MSYVHCVFHIYNARYRAYTIYVPYNSVLFKYFAAFFPLVINIVFHNCPGCPSSTFLLYTYYRMYINQRDITGWEKRGCGIACVGMVLGVAGQPVMTDTLVEEALALRGYLDGIGWKHSTLARMLTNRKLPAYTQEFTLPDGDTALFTAGVKKIREQTAAGNPVIVSVHRGFDPGSGSTHLVVITAVTDDAFVIQDPDYEHGGPDIVVPFTAFSRAWRGYTIFTDLSSADR